MNYIERSHPIGRYQSAIYNAPSYTGIALVAAYPNSGSSIIDELLCENLRQAGMNNAICSIGLDKIKDSLNNAAKYDIKIFLKHIHLYGKPDVSNEERIAYCSGMVNTFKGLSGLGGWWLGNFPTFSELEYADGISELYDVILSNDQYQHPIYIGIHGYPLGTYIEKYSYRDYVLEFQGQLGPSFWPMSYQPYFFNNGKTDVDYLGFFNALEIFARLSKYYLRPFWYNVVCEGMIKGNSGYPAPTYSSLKMIIFSALAYGAKGILFWRYLSGDGSGSEVFYAAPVNADDKTTAVWHYAKK